LLDLHAMASPDGRAALAPVIFSKIVDFRKAARRGQVPDAERARLEERIRDYSNQLRKV
jgi:hypothetical protein